MSEAPARQLVMEISDADLTPTERAVVQSAHARDKGADKALGGAAATQRAVFDVLPAVIARRLEAITPPTFVVAEIEVKLSLGGKVGGVGLDGDISVTLKPSP
ncbi:MAG: hypothetical protein ACOZNI_20095 [Myxococcota bacterium]